LIVLRSLPTKSTAFYPEAHYKPLGSDIDNYGQLTKLPEKLYHVTTNFGAVQQAGGLLKSRRDLNMKAGTGLGGGDDTTISFTGNFKRAGAFNVLL
jgi:hypothetical protein